MAKSVLCYEGIRSAFNCQDNRIVRYLCGAQALSSWTASGLVKGEIALDSERINVTA